MKAFSENILCTAAEKYNVELNIFITNIQNNFQQCKNEVITVGRIHYDNLFNEFHLYLRYGPTIASFFPQKMVDILLSY